MWSSLKGGEQFMCEPRIFFCECFWFLWHVSDVANQTETNFMLLNNIFFAFVCSSQDLNASTLGFGLSSKAECERDCKLREGSFIRNLTPLGTGGSTTAESLKEIWAVVRLASVCVCVHNSNCRTYRNPKPWRPSSGPMPMRKPSKRWHSA